MPRRAHALGLLSDVAHRVEVMADTYRSRAREFISS